MIHPFCSALQARRRPVPVNTSSRRTGSGLDLGKSSVSDTCLTRSIQRADIRPSAPDVKRGVRRPLTIERRIAAVLGAVPRGGRAPASAGPRRLAPLRARPALGVNVAEQLSPY